MLIPAERDVKGIVGSSFDQQWQLWSDTAQTVPFPWTGGWSVSRLEIDDANVPTLEEGSGLTVATGLVTAYLPSSVTKLITAKATSYRLVLEDPNGDDQFPIVGRVYWEKP